MRPARRSRPELNARSRPPGHDQPRPWAVQGHSRYAAEGVTFLQATRAYAIGRLGRVGGVSPTTSGGNDRPAADADVLVRARVRLWTCRCSGRILMLFDRLPWPR